MTLGSILRRAALLWPNRVALVDEQGRSFSYREWNGRVNQLANALTRLGVGSGTRVASFSAMNRHSPQSTRPPQKLGAVAVPVNYRLSATELAFVLNDCQAVMLLYQSQLQSVVEGARPTLESVRQLCASAKRPTAMRSTTRGCMGTRPTRSRRRELRRTN